MSNEYSEAKVNPNICVGNAIIIGTEKGWALPGRKNTTDARHAKMMAIRMSKLMKGLEL